LQVQAVGLVVLGDAPRGCAGLPRAPLRPQALRDRAADIFLQREDVFQRPLEAAAPDLRPARRVHQLDRDRELIASRGDAARHDDAHRQIPRQGLQLRLAAAVPERDAARDHAQLRQPRQAVDHALRDPVAEVLRAGVARNRERQHRHRVVTRGRAATRQQKGRERGE
jgi:hypothetical protein